MHPPLTSVCIGNLDGKHNREDSRHAAAIIDFHYS